MKRKSASKKLLPLMLILMLILGISMPANVVEVKDTSQNIYNVVQNSDGTYTITVKDGNAYKNLETGKVALFSAKEMGTDTDIALKVQNITKVKLSEEAVDPDDIEMLEDLIVAAANEALRQADEANTELMSKMTGGLGGGFPF